MPGRAIVAQRLNVLVQLRRQIMSGNIESQSAAESDVQDLQSFANAEDGQTAGECVFHRDEFPFVSFKISFLQNRWVRHWLPQILQRDIRSSAKQQSIRILERNRTRGGIENLNRRMFGEKWSKPFLVFAADPPSKFRHHRLL